MKYAAILISVMFLMACEGAFGVEDPNELFGADTSATGDRGVVASALTGVELYQQNCASCHGAQAEGAPSWPYSIQGFTPVEPLILKGRGAMPAIPLASEDIAKVQDFLSSLAVPTEQLDGPGIYQRYCASCHGADASGGPSYPNSIQAYTPIEDIVLQGRGAMDPVQISVEQTQMVQDWLLTLAAPAEELDGVGLYQRYCASCHGADATGDVEWSGSIQGYEPIETIVLQGRGNMDPIAITPGQTQMIQEWLLTLAPPLSSLNGEEVYNRLCVSCHGNQGAGLAGEGPQLRYDDDSFSSYWTRNGRGTQSFNADMPSYPEDMISDQQLDELFAFVNDAPHATSGEDLYVQYCANCHAVNGSGGPSGHSIRGEDSITSISRNGRGGTNYSSRRNYMSSWNQNQLSDSELQMIAQYVAGL